ncbi:MAG: sensor histidine kinase [Rhodocyclales bacterium]|nr:sensor histidine kinase [Rhodocyclales bacterium]
MSDAPSQSASQVNANSGIRTLALQAMATLAMFAALAIGAIAAGWVGVSAVLLAVISSYAWCRLARDMGQPASRQSEVHRRARAFMQRAVDVIPEPIFVKGADGRLVMVNEAYCAQRNLTREQILGKTASALTRSDALASLIQQEDVEVLAGKQIFKEECIAHPVTGADLYQIVAKARSEDEEGNPLIVGTFVDITSVRIAEQEARDALAAQSRLRAFLQFVFDALPTPLFVKDTQHRYIMTNRAHTLSTGMPMHELLGKRASDLLRQDIAELIDASEDEMLLADEGLVHESEHAIFNQQGVVRQEILRKVVGRDVEGQRVIIGTATDITSLRHAEARWQFALEGAGDGLWDWDLSSAKVFYSRHWKVMQGFDEAEIGNSEAERTRRIHPDDAEAAQAALDVHLSGRVPIYICELRQMRKDGTYMWLLDRGRVVEHSADGKPLRMIGIYTDITHHKDAEEELRRHRDSLEDMVEEQTTHLIQAKKEAERANAAKSQFLANMSHELRTPMHAVLSFARLGEEKAAKPQPSSTEAPDKLRTYFQRIRESGDRLLGLLNDLLDLSKLESGRMVLRIQRVLFESVVEEALREFEASLLAKRLNATLHNEACDTLVMADDTRLAQVVRNLLSNAIKFSPEGSNITLTFRPFTQTEAGAERGVELIVADEGIGIPAGELESVFDKFVQSSKTRNNAGGTGLGLPICREIVTAHHGQIFARNRAQQGTEFVVRIPRYPRPEPTPAAEASDQSKAG